MNEEEDNDLTLNHAPETDFFAQLARDQEAQRPAAQTSPVNGIIELGTTAYANNNRTVDLGGPASGTSGTVTCSIAELVRAIRGSAGPSTSNPSLEEHMATLAKATTDTLKCQQEANEEARVRADMKPITVDIKEHHLHDNGIDIIDFVARTKIRPYRGPLKEYWAALPTKQLPVVEDLNDAHIGTNDINPKILHKLHDRGEQLDIKMFLKKNQMVDAMPKRITTRGNSDGTIGAFEFDYKEPQNIWEIADALYAYTTALHTVRPEDWSGLVLLKVFHKYRCLSNSGRDQAVQAKALVRWINGVLQKNGTRGMNKAPPLDMEEVEQVLLKDLHHNRIDPATCLQGPDPYGPRSRKRTQYDNPEGDDVPRKKGKGKGKQSTQPQHPPTNNNQEAYKGVAFKDLPLAVKIQKCCKFYNSAEGNSTKIFIPKYKLKITEGKNISLDKPSHI